MGLTFKTIPPASRKAEANSEKTLGRARAAKAHSHKPVPKTRLRGTAPVKIGVPIPPTYSEEKGEKPLYDEQQVARVELLMLKGVRDRRQLMALLEVDDDRTMDRYINRVHARWELLGTTQDYARHRGEGLKRLDTIESELWSKLQEEDRPSATGVDRRNQTVILKTLLDVHQQRVSILGLTPKVIEALGTTDLGEQKLLDARGASQALLGKVAARMLEIIKENAGATGQPPMIEHDAPNHG